jgi:DNA-binding response OmpR family regulator
VGGLGNSQRVVVVVEDDEITRNLLTTLLEEEGFKTITVADGNQALQVIERLEPDLVTLDLTLPGKGGDEVLVELRQKELSRVTAVLIVSATAGHLPPGIRALASGCVNKPFNIDDLLQAVNRLAGNGHKRLPNVA